MMWTSAALGLIAALISLIGPFWAYRRRRRQWSEDKRTLRFWLGCLGLTVAFWAATWGIWWSLTITFAFITVIFGR
jgi:hypothetical protein